MCKGLAIYNNLFRQFKRHQFIDKIYQRNEEISVVPILKLQIKNELCGTPSHANSIISDECISPSHRTLGNIVAPL